MTEQRRFELVGAPYDGAATLGWPGSRYAPDAIRKELSWMTMRAQKDEVYSLEEDRLVPAPSDLLTDSGDAAVVPHDLMATIDAVAHSVGSVVQRGNVPILLGGDDCLLYAGVKGFHDAVDGSVGIIHFDAHLDLMDENTRQGRYSHSSGMRRSLELDRVRKEHMIQVGLRHFNYPTSFEFIAAEQLTHVTAFEVYQKGFDYTLEKILSQIEGVDHVYWSFDIDCIDPAYAPGAGAHEPGGITSREALEFIKQLAPRCDAFAVTEVNPMKDVQGMTANLAAYLCYYFAIYGTTQAGN